MGTKLKHYSTIGTNNKEAAEKFYDFVNGRPAK